MPTSERIERTTHSAFDRVILNSVSRTCAVAMFALLALASANVLAMQAEVPNAARESAVGMTQKIDQIVLPGSKVEVRPITQDSSVVVRIIEVFPHGSDTRYDIEYYGLDPGSYNLLDFLQRADGSSLENVPAVPITITAQLPAGQVEPTKLATRELTGLGGYRTMGIVAGVLWLVGLVMILLVGRGRRRDGATEVVRRVSLADRLRPLVDEAIRGEMSHARLSELELTLIAFWRNRLSLDHEQASSVIGRLRTHEEAGPLLVQLETWLHKPNASQEVDVAKLLEPYQSLPPDALELELTES